MIKKNKIDTPSGETVTLGNMDHVFRRNCQIFQKMTKL